jgi:hypothetical protein
MATKTKVTRATKTKVTRATKTNSSSEQREALALRRKGLSFRAIEKKIFGSDAGNGSWAQYNLRQFGIA